MKPIQAETAVCPTPHKAAYTLSIGVLEARYTYAVVALVTTPDIMGVKIPSSIIRTGKNLPNLCFRKTTKAPIAAS